MVDVLETVLSQGEGRLGARRPVEIRVDAEEAQDEHVRVPFSETPAKLAHHHRERSGRRIPENPAVDEVDRPYRRPVQRRSPQPLRETEVVDPADDEARRSSIAREQEDVRSDDLGLQPNHCQEEVDLRRQAASLEALPGRPERLDLLDRPGDRHAHVGGGRRPLREGTPPRPCGTWAGSGLIHRGGRIGCDVLQRAVLPSEWREASL